MIQANLGQRPIDIVDGFSLEITTKDVESLRAVAAGIPPATRIAIAFLPGEESGARVTAAKRVRDLGFEPIPHFSARRVRSAAEFEDYLAAVVAEAGVNRCFVIAGDASESEGPFHDSSELIASGSFETNGIIAIGIGGHPEGHPNMSEARRFEVLTSKCADIERRGMAPLIVTQFAFDAEPVLTWLEALRLLGIQAPVRLGIPGPAGIKTLMRFASRCGVGASTAVLAKYGISISRLLGAAGPDRLVHALVEGLGPQHGSVSLHFYPFGGLEKTLAWINEYHRSH